MARSQERKKKDKGGNGGGEGTTPAADASTHFTMDITGLCAIWRGDLDTTHEMNMLLLRGMDELKHRPVITFDMRHFHSLIPPGGEEEAEKKADAGKAGRVEVVQLPSGEQVGSWELEGKIVRIEKIPGAWPSCVKLLGDERTAYACPTDPTDEMALHWIPSVGQACRDANVRVDQGYLTSSPGRSHNGNGHSPLEEVLARVDVPQGFLYSLSRIGEVRDADVWRFMDDDELIMEQLIAETARFEIRDIPGEYIKITAFPYGHRHRVETLLLRAVDDAVRVTLTNLPTIRERNAETFPHWGAYYSILERPPDCQSIPVRSESRPRPDRPPSGGTEGDSVAARGVRPIMCSPGLIP